MSFLPVVHTDQGIHCKGGKTKQKVGLEHDINKLVAKYKRTGKMPNLLVSGDELKSAFDADVVDLTQVGDFQACQERIVSANQLFESYPSAIRRRFNNDVQLFAEFIDQIPKSKARFDEAVEMGMIVVSDPKPEVKPDATANKNDKEEGDTK